MDPNWLAMAYQDMMRRRMMENQQASQYLQQTSFAPQMQGAPTEPQIDMNQPHLWGLQGVIDRHQDMMRDPGGNWGQEEGDKVRQRNRQHELDYYNKFNPRRPMDVGT